MEVFPFLLYNYTRSYSYSSTYYQVVLTYLPAYLHS